VPPHLIEFLVLFFAGPAVFAYTRHRIPAIPALWVWMAWCLYVLRRDPGFDRSHLWKSDAFARYAPSIFGIFGASALLGVVLVRRFAPELFLTLPRTRRGTWAALMALYPVLSVYPQGIVFRAFIFARYRDLFPSDPAMVLASAAAFAWVHIIFHNRLALILTALGGILFGLRYLQTGSLFITCVEHSLYGCAIFTIGVGRSLHHASMRR
jgi:membrane protease YdiL (CAAX protease family)